MPHRHPAQRGPPSRQPPQEEPANETPSDEEEIPTVHTGIRRTTADLDMNPHTRSSVHPYVAQDLKDAIKVDLYSWIGAVLGIASERIETWTSQIAENRWFDDEVVQHQLREYCKASTEPHRYQPFCELAGRILELARGCLDGIDLTNSYPVDSVKFIDTHKRQVVRIPEHGLLGAERLLDITMTYGEAAEEFIKTNKIHWRDVLHFIELKRSMSLVAALAKEKNRRARSSTPVPPTTAWAPQTDSLTSQDSDDDIPTGSKRPRESDDDIDGSANKVPRGIPNETEGVEQSGSYALEVLSCTYGTRLFCHSSLILDDKLSLHYYDACGIIQTSQHLSLIQDFEKTAAVFVALASCSLERFGVMPTSIIRTPTPYINPPHKFTDCYFAIEHPISKVPIQVTLAKSLYAQYVSSGRRTFAYTIKALPQLSAKSLMVKFSYQVVTRRPEYDLVEVARKAGIGHLPDVHAWADIWKMSEGARRVLMETMNDEERERQEDRVLRMVVYTEYEPIKSLFSRRCDLIPVMVEQMVTCLHDLRYKANMLHRDISVDNIMVCMRGDKYYFILNDFDMAVVLPKDDKTPYIPSSKHRTGTYSFMAIALVQNASLHTKFDDPSTPVKHLLCHDLESLFWVSLWCVLALFLDEVPPATKNVYLDTVKGWSTSKAWHIKQALSAVPLTSAILSFPPSALCLDAWFKGWRGLFLKISTTEYEHELDPDFDKETIGGTFTKDTILDALTPLMPFRQTEGEMGADIEEKEQDAEEERTADAAEEEGDRMHRGVKASQVNGTGRRKGKVQGKEEAQGEGRVQGKAKAKAKGKEKAQTKAKAKGKKTRQGKKGVQGDAGQDPVPESDKDRGEKDEDEARVKARGKKRKGNEKPRKGANQRDTTKTNDTGEDHEPSTSQASAVAVSAVNTKRQSRQKPVTVEAETVKAAVMSRLRPRKAP